MGFTSEICRVTNRADKELSIKEFYAINDFFCYEEHRDFYKDQFPTAEDFFNRFVRDYEMPSDRIIYLFENDYVQREYDKSIFEHLADWCSGGAYFHDWIVDNLRQDESEDSDDSVKLTQDKCLKLLNHCVETLNNMEVQPVELTRAFTEVWDETFCDKSTITSVPCDGIEVVDWDGNLKRLYGDDVEETDIYTLPGLYDKYIAYKQLLNAVTKILCTTDWENQVVIYSGGW